jgi:hypothetical protein
MFLELELGKEAKMSHFLLRKWWLCLNLPSIKGLSLLSIRGKIEVSVSSLTFFRLGELENSLLSI